MIIFKKAKNPHTLKKTQAKNTTTKNPHKKNLKHQTKIRELKRTRLQSSSRKLGKKNECQRSENTIKKKSRSL